jgi:hypothetical protein
MKMVTGRQVNDAVAVYQIVSKHRTGMNVAAVVDLSKEIAALFFDNPANRENLSNAIVSRVVTIKAVVE